MRARCMKKLLLMPALACATLPTLAYADEGRVVALSPAEVAAAKEAGAKAHAETAALDGAPRYKRQIHGEVGFGIGTNGYRSAYGTAVAPLGDTGVLAISLADGQMNQLGRRR